MVRPVDPSSWRVASTTVFNGSQENHFDSTSLHLSFTDYYVPVHLIGQQNQDSQIFYLESFVSVYDSGKWVGDINILQALSSPSVSRPSNACRHTSATEPELGVNTGLVSAESWHDILDPPVETFVVRANGNWVARLAVSAMLLQTMPRSNLQSVVICPRWSCWYCMPSLAPSTKWNTGTRQDYCPPMARDRAYIY
jgi:hypothetical protein